MSGRIAAAAIRVQSRPLVVVAAEEKTTPKKVCVDLWHEDRHTTRNLSWVTLARREGVEEGEGEREREREWRGGMKEREKERRGNEREGERDRELIFCHYFLVPLTIS